MSGIAGIFNVDGRPTDAALLHAMADASRHRGPDGVEFWSDGCAGLAFLMLATTPEAAREHQPWSSDDGNLRMVFDGRIDNRDDLRSELESRGAILRDDTDVEIAGRCFEIWGEETWNRLIGDFAVVFFDRRRRKLYAARDPMGFRPFHYFFDGKTFLFASDLIQILQDRRIARTPNEEFFAEVLAGGPFTRRGTVIPNIYRLEGAACLSVDSGGIRHREYYDLEAAKPLRFKTYDDAAAGLREVLTEAVRCRMRATGDVASHLSGGLDSSSIVCIAHDLSQRGVVNNRVQSYSMILTDPNAQEREFIAEVERACGRPTCECPGLEADASWYANYVTEHIDLPPYPNSAMFEPLMQAVSAGGMRVALSGHGGDHLMNGDEGDLSSLVRGIHFVRFVHAIRLLAGNISAGEVRGSWVRILLRSAIWPLLPKWLQHRLRWLLRRGQTDSFAWLSWIESKLVRRFDLEDRARRALQDDADYPEGIRSICYLIRDGWTAKEMESFERAAAGLKIEYRYPFCDRRVAEFICGLPEEIRWNQGFPKLLMRRAVKGLLPERIRTRTTKAHFTDLMMRSLKRTGDSLFDQLSVATMGWVNEHSLKQAHGDAWRLFRAHDWSCTGYLWPGIGLQGAEFTIRLIGVDPDRLAHTGGRTQANSASPG